MFSAVKRGFSFLQNHKKQTNLRCIHFHSWATFLIVKSLNKSGENVLMHWELGEEKALWTSSQLVSVPFLSDEDDCIVS